MFDFKKIRDRFGDNPFSADLANVVVIQTDRPYKAGEFVNYLGSNYRVQKDIGARKNILLVIDGLVAIPETPLDSNPLNTRLVLDRQVSEEAPPPTPVLPWLWTANVENETVAYPNGRLRGKIRNTELGAGSFRKYFSVYADDRDAVHSLTMEAGFNATEWTGSAFKNTSEVEEAITGFPYHRSTSLPYEVRRTNNNIFQFSTGFAGVVARPDLDITNAANSVLILENAPPEWFHSGINVLTDKPDNVSYVMEMNSFRSESNSDTVIEYSTEPWPTHAYFNFTTYVTPDLSFPGTHESVFFWQYQRSRDFFYADVVNVIDRDIIKSTVTNSSFTMPLVVDETEDRYIVYEAENYNLEIFEQQFFQTPVRDACTKYEINGTANLYYLNSPKGEKVKINSAPAFLIPINDFQLQNRKDSYEPGDTLTMTFDDNREYAIGFASESGNYRTANTDDDPLEDRGFLVKCKEVDTTIPRFEQVRVVTNYQYNYVTDLDKWGFNQPSDGSFVDLNNFPPSGQRSGGGTTITVPAGAAISFQLVDSGVRESRPGDPLEQCDDDGLTPTFSGSGSNHEVFYAEYAIVIDGVTSNQGTGASDGGLVRRFLFNSAGSRQYAYDCGFTASGFTPTIESRELIPLPDWGEPSPFDPGTGGIGGPIPENSARQDQIDYFNEVFTTPTDFWGYIPTTELETDYDYYPLVQGVKGQITSISIDSTKLGEFNRRVGSDEVQPIPLAELQFINSFTFRIDEVLTDKFSSEYLQMYEREFHYYSYNYEPFGFVCSGNGFNICQYDMNSSPDFGVGAGSIYPGVALSQPRNADSYVWRKGERNKDYLYHFYSDLYFVDDYEGATDEYYIEKFELKYNEEKSQYDLHFVDWVKADFSFRVAYSEALYMKPERKVTSRR